MSPISAVASGRSPQQHFSASEITALTFVQVKSCRMPLAIAQHMEFAIHPSLDAANQPWIWSPFLRLEAVRCALRCVASIINTSVLFLSDHDLYEDHKDAVFGASAETVVERFGWTINWRCIDPAQAFLDDVEIPFNTLRSSTRRTRRSFGKKSLMRFIWSSRSQNKGRCSYR